MGEFLSVFNLKKNRSMLLTESEGQGKWWASFLWVLGIFIIAEILLVLLFFIILLVAGLIGSKLFSGNLEQIFDNSILDLLSFLPILVVTLFCAKKINHRSLKSLGFFREHLFRHYSLGVVIGAVELLFVLIGCLLVKSLSITLNSSINWGSIFLLLIGFAIQGLTEEVLCRGYLMNAISSKKGVWAGIIGNSIFFSLLHGFNPNVSLIALINLFLAGIFFSLLFYWTDNIWLVGGAHMSWNFLLGPVFGIEVSGQSFGNSIFTTTIDSAHSLVNGGSFGLEAGLMYTTVSIVLTIVLWIMLKKNYSNK